VKAKASVPDEVIGDPVTVKPVGAVKATEDTDPEPGPSSGVNWL
jgi:hypothetical protein